jgi:hypothetical protein
MLLKRLSRQIVPFRGIAESLTVINEQSRDAQSVRFPWAGFSDADEDGRGVLE